MLTMLFGSDDAQAARKPTETANSAQVEIRRKRAELGMLELSPPNNGDATQTQAKPTRFV
ncbi:hypothetical protein ACFWXH_07420 [Mesorhizobium sp. NPDC059054]|uniref:hypothetical protein n=1 Tax=unclassified Mesorhizobium TaxID=325217 RepID=UPI001FCDD77D|nr:hypothetical protein [Mesorhizobium sp. 1M-11]